MTYDKYKCPNCFKVVQIRKTDSKGKKYYWTSCTAFNDDKKVRMTNIKYLKGKVK